MDLHTSRQAPAFDIDGLLDLWTIPPASPGDAVAAFRTRYADPVLVNGTPLSAADLADRAAALRAAFPHLERRVIDVTETPDRVAVVFTLSGRHTGTWSTSAGDLAATGQELTIRVIDVLTVSDGLVTELWMAADELGALAAHGLARLGPTHG